MNFKKVLAGVAAGSMVAAMAVVPTFADDSYTATVAFADGSWSVQNWDTTTTVTGDGTYSITVDVAGIIAEAGDTAPEASNGFTVACVDIAGLLGDVDVEDSGITITDASITADGTVVATDYVYGDTEEKGNLRIEFYNAYGPTNKGTYASWNGGSFIGEGGKYDENSYSSVTAKESIVFTFTIAGLGSSAETPDTDDSANDGDVAPVAYLAAVVALAGVAMAASKKARA
jgi:hypothetical protein